MKIVTSHPDFSRKKLRDCTIPSIGLGTYELTGQTCRRAVREAIEMGYRHIDTAQAYENEAEVGQAIRESGIERGDIFLTDKIWHNKLEPEKLKESFSESMDKLKTDYIDLLLIHWPSPDGVPLRDTIQAMHELKNEGKIRWIGVSNFPPTLMEKALTMEDIMANQVEYHPFLSQSDMSELAVRQGFFLIAYSPLAQGEVFGNEIIRNIANRYGKNPAQVALRWLVQQRLTVAIPRSSSPEHISSNFDIFDFELTEQEMILISELGGEKRLVDPEFAPDWE